MSAPIGVLFSLPHRARKGRPLRIDPPPMKWSAVMIRKRRIESGEQATEGGRDCLEVAAG